MRPLEGIVLALQQVWAHKLKSAFTLLGVVIGVTFLIAVITVVEGMNRYVQDDLAGSIFGVNTITIVRRTRITTGPDSEEARRRAARNPELTLHDVEIVRAAAPDAWLLSFYEDSDGQEVRRNEYRRRNVRLIGGSPDHAELQGMPIEAGRGLTELDERRGLKNAVIGAEISDRLFPDESPLDKEIRLGPHRFMVVGTFERQGGLFGSIRDAAILIPFATYRQNFSRSKDEVDAISIKMRNPEDLEAVTLAVEAAMRSDRALRPGEENTFHFETSEELLGTWRKISAILCAAIPALVGVSLVVGGIVIMNIMLLSVAGRIKEIGIRKAIGARRQDILIQFLAESSTLSLLGAAVGIGLGIALGAVVDRLSPLPAAVPMWAIVVALAVGLFVGVASGMYPAWKAANQDPIVALHRE
ncbi:MAG: ABC transporter permease [Gemmatimonadales bacterium]|nr:MAG: ABC transporter permease [Gemmatimonadales bacterium]